MTKTQIKSAEITREWSRLRDELCAVIKSEFPVGTKVKWRIGKHWQTGVVVEVPRWDFSSDITVKNSRTGTTINKEAVEFELDSSEVKT